MNIDTLVSILRRKNRLLSEIAELIMKNNYFTYNGYKYQQLFGIAMGTNCAVALANIYMGELIDRHIANHPQVYHYGRYIDDIIFIFKGT